MKQDFLALAAAAFVMLGAQPGVADQTDVQPTATPTQASNEFVPPKPKEGFRYPDCFCTDSVGKRVDLGKTACLQIGSQSFTARCAMSQNNPTWRRVSEGCPSV